MFNTTCKHKIKVTSHRGEEYIVPFYGRFCCPKCGVYIYFRNKRTGTQINFTDESSINEICLPRSSWHNIYCKEPLYMYKCSVVTEKFQKHIGNFRSSPISNVSRTYKRKHTSMSNKERILSSKVYKLKNDFCYVEPLYNDDSDEPCYIPVVKFRKCTPKTNFGARKSSGWKSSQKRLKQWYR